MWSNWFARSNNLNYEMWALKDKNVSSYEKYHKVPIYTGIYWYRKSYVCKWKWRLLISLCITSSATRKKKKKKTSSLDDILVSRCLKQASIYFFGQKRTYTYSFVPRYIQQHNKKLSESRSSVLDRSGHFNITHCTFRFESIVKSTSSEISFAEMSLWRFIFPLSMGWDIVMSTLIFWKVCLIFRYRLECFWS